MYHYCLLLMLAVAAGLCSCAEQQAGSTPQSRDGEEVTEERSNRASQGQATDPPDERVGTNPSDGAILQGSMPEKFSGSAGKGEGIPLLLDSAENVALPVIRRLPPVSMHNGVNHAHVHRRGNGYGSSASARQHDWLRSIGANAIAITPFGFQRGARSDELVGFGPNDTPGTRDRSMKLEDMAAEIDSAHKRGLRVMLKPHIWSHDFWEGKEWHGSVDQNSAAEHANWWASYRKMILYYGEFAERSGVDYFCIGTELLQMTTKYPDEWRALIADVRSIYKGKLTYAAHWDREWKEIPFWDTLDFIGIGAYFPLKVPDTASVDQLVEAWGPYRHTIDSIARKFSRHVVFLEIGYRPVEGTWREPWLYSGGTFSSRDQGKAFEALFRAFKDDPWFKGVYVWKTFTDPDAAHRTGEQTDFQFKGLDGEKVLKEWWK